MEQTAHPHESEIQATIDILEGAKSRIGKTMVSGEIAAINRRIVATTQRSINYLKTLIGQDVSDDERDLVTDDKSENTTSVDHSQPIKKIMGKVVRNNEDEAIAPVAIGPSNRFPANNLPDLTKTSQQVAADDLRKNVDELQGLFFSLDNASILDKYDELTIRGVGKRAGLPVTEQSPAKVNNNKFLDQVRAALQKKKEIAEAGNPAQPGADADTTTATANTNDKPVTTDPAKGA